MATAAFPGNEVYLYKLLTLTIDQGTILVRKIFDEAIDNVPLHQLLAQEKNVIDRLRNSKVITINQYHVLFHGSGKPPTTEDFDLITAVTLLRNLKACGLNPHFSWHALPQSGDTSREANICRLLRYRNELAHVSSTTAIDDVDFNEKWSNIEKALLGLNDSLRSPIPNLQKCIDDLKNAALGPKKRKMKTDEKDDYEKKVLRLEQEMGELRKMVLHQKDHYDPGRTKSGPETESRYYETEGKGGLFVLINDENDRKGSEVDRKNLIEFFQTTLNFDVMDMNKCGDNIIDFLAEAKKRAIDKSDKYYCLVFFIGCHGGKEFLSFKNVAKPITFEDIKQRFNGEHLKQYRGRPKIFLTQFCRGGLTEKGGVPETDNIGTANLKGNDNADIFVLFSTVKEHCSFRDAKTGSIIVDKCVETFARDWRDNHLEDMMLTVRGKVADLVFFDENFLICRQTAVVESSFTKRLLFRRSVDEK